MTILQLDGTGVRDFIHVTDLAQGHVAALNYLERQVAPVGFLPINLGTGKGTSVLELVTAFSKVSGQPYSLSVYRPPRR